jgi:hypothetical protein
VGKAKTNHESHILSQIKLTCEIVFVQLSVDFEKLVLKKVFEYCSSTQIPQATKCVGIIIITFV